MMFTIRESIRGVPGWVLLCVAAVQSGTLPVAPPVNLAPNPGFESATLAEWRFQAQACLDTANPCAGRQSLRQEAAPGHVWNCVQMANMIPVRAGRLYRLALFSRNTLPAGQALFGLREIDRQNKTIGYSWCEVARGNTNWLPSALTLLPNERTTGLQIYLRVDEQAPAGSAWWDELVLEETDQPFGTNRAVWFDWAPTDGNTVWLDRDGKPDADAYPLWLNAGPRAVGSSLTVERALAGDSKAAVWRQVQKIDRCGPLRVDVPLSGLREGAYEVRVAAERDDGRERLETRFPLTLASRPAYPALEPVRESRVGPDARLRVNGRPFSSVMFYHTPLTTQFLARVRSEYGVTTAQVSGGDSVDALCRNVDIAWQAGLYSWAVLFHPAMFDAKLRVWKDAELAEAVNRLKAHPGLLGWDLIDEPDGLNVTPAEVARAAALVRGLDPGHVIWVNLCFKGAFAKYAGISDVASYDTYPFPLAGLDVVEQFNRAAQASAPDKPLLCVLQAYGAPNRRGPTPEELRAEAYYSLCDGMCHFHYYVWSDPPPALSMENTPELRAAVRRLNAELFRLHPFLFSSQAVDFALSGPSASRLKAAVRDTEDGPVAVIVNPEPAPCAPFALTLARARLVSAADVFTPSRPVEIRDGQLNDSLPGYGVGVYRLNARQK